MEMNSESWNYWGKKDMSEQDMKQVREKHAPSGRLILPIAKSLDERRCGDDMVTGPLIYFTANLHPATLCFAPALQMLRSPPELENI